MQTCTRDNRATTALGPLRATALMDAVLQATIFAITLYSVIVNMCITSCNVEQVCILTTECTLCTTETKRLKFSKSQTESDVSVQLAS
jgi:hypothetical protein